MKEMNDNLYEDIQTIYLKKDKKEEVINSYECFGWKVIKETQHPRFENILEIKFTRPHFIENKEDLQFLEVNMECDINKLGKLEKNKHALSTFLLLTMIPFAFLIIAGLVFTLINLKGITQIITVTFLTMFIVFLAGAIPIVTLKTFKRENVTYETKHKDLSDRVRECCEKARNLIGGQ